MKKIKNNPKKEKDFDKINILTTDFVQGLIDKGYNVGMISHIMTAQATNFSLCWSDDPRKVFSNLLSAITAIINVHLSAEFNEETNSDFLLNYEKQIKKSEIN